VDDHPLEAERVGLAVDLGVGILGDAAEQFLGVARGRGELARGEGLEDQRRIAGRLE
jgi:hypothetical protein